MRLHCLTVFFISFSLSLLLKPILLFALSVVWLWRCRKKRGNLHYLPACLNETEDYYLPSKSCSMIKIYRNQFHTLSTLAYRRYCIQCCSVMKLFPSHFTGADFAVGCGPLTVMLTPAIPPDDSIAVIICEAVSMSWPSLTYIIIWLFNVASSRAHGPFPFWYALQIDFMFGCHSLDR